VADLPAPSWHLLPHEPEAFFGLEEGYDRKALKRKYNTLLRQFKPEKFPAEFQRIRAAFETLDNQLRYGQQVEKLIRPQFDQTWGQASGEPSTDAENDPSNDSTPSNLEPDQPQPKKQKTLAERLESESPDDILAELLRKDQKSAYDFFAIGLIADTRSDRKATTLLKWVLSGLKENPHDGALFSLLYQLLRSDIALKQIPALLGEIAKVIRDDRYYFLTEPLWDRYLRKAKFAEFAELLRRCQAKLKDFRISGRMTFYVHLLRHALWRADQGWVAETFEFLEQNYRELPPSLEVDLDVLAALREYREARDEFLDGSEIRDAIDQVIRAYCTLEDRDAQRSFLDLQVSIASGEIDVWDGFHGTEASTDDVWFQIWIWLDGEYSSRLGIEQESDEILNPKQTRRSIKALLRTMELKSARTSNGRFLDWASFLYIGSNWVVSFLFFFTMLAVAWQLIPSNAEGSTWFMVNLVLLGIAYGLGKLCQHKLTLPAFQKWYWHLTTECYSQTWRHELVSYFRRSNLSFHQVLQVIHGLSKDDSSFNMLVLNLSHQDMGLILTSISVKYLV